MQTVLYIACIYSAIGSLWILASAISDLNLAASLSGLIRPRLRGWPGADEGSESDRRLLEELHSETLYYHRNRAWYNFFLGSSYRAYYLRQIERLLIETEFGERHRLKRENAYRINELIERFRAGALTRIGASVFLWLAASFGTVFASSPLAAPLPVTPGIHQESDRLYPHDSAAELADQPGSYTVKVFYATDRLPAAAADIPARRGAADMFFNGLKALMVMLLVLGVASALRWLDNGGYFQKLPYKFMNRGVLALSWVSGALIIVFWVWSASLAMWGPTKVKSLSRSYNSERNSTDSPMKYGVCRVTVPRDHKIGALESPSIFRFRYAEDPRKDVVLQQVEEVVPGEFLRLIRATINDEFKNKGLREAFVFVHGFNVSFEDAARRTAQLAYDLEFKGAPIFFGWPSQGQFLAYTVDETNVEWSIPHLEGFLGDIAARSGATRVYLIAHSMGNRCLANALRRLKTTSEAPSVFQEVVLTAPDIDADTFQTDIAPAILPNARRITLYASSKDKALTLSKSLHKYRRAGDTEGEVVVLPPMETVDVSSVDTSFDGHSYYGDNSAVISDLFYLIHDGKPAADRFGMKRVDSRGKAYWVFLQRR